MALARSLIILGIFTFLSIVVSSLPLYFAVKIFRKKISFGRVMLITILSGIIVSLINLYFRSIGGIVSFIILIWVYREAFRLKWLNALLVWFIQIVFVFLLFAIIAAVSFFGFGLSLIF
ncbi:MAG: hypothetical protein ACLFPQ_03950 [Candidatus Woesearchaeota archaeon]